MPLDKILQSYVNQYGLDYVKALKLTEKQKEFLISDNCQVLIKEGGISPEEVLSVFGRAYNITHFKNICKLIALKKLTLQQAIVLFKEDCEKLEIDNLFNLVKDNIVQIPTIIKLEEAQFALLRNDSLIDLIRTNILSFEQAIGLNTHNCRYFFSKEILILFHERKSLNFDQVKSLKPREFRNIIRLFPYIDSCISLNEILNFKQLQSDIIHCDRIFKLIPDDLTLRQVLTLTHEQLSYFESDEIYLLIEKGLISIEQILSIQNSLLFNQIIRDIIVSNPLVIQEIVSSPSHSEQGLLGILSFNEFPDLIKNQQISLETCFALRNRHNILLANPKFIELLKHEYANMAQFIDLDIYHCQQLSKRLNEPVVFKMIKDKLITIKDCLMFSDFHVELLKFPPLYKLLQLNFISIESLIRLDKEQCASLMDKLSINSIHHQFIAGMIQFSDLIILPLQIDSSLTDDLKHKYQVVSSNFFSPPNLLIKLPEHIESIQKTKLSC